MRSRSLLSSTPLHPVASAMLKFILLCRFERADDHPMLPLPPGQSPPANAPRPSHKYFGPRTRKPPIPGTSTLDFNKKPKRPKSSKRPQLPQSDPPLNAAGPSSLHQAEMSTPSHATQPGPPVHQSQTYTPHMAQPKAEMFTLSYATHGPPVRQSQTDTPHMAQPKAVMFTLSHATQPRPPVRQSQTYTPHIAQPQAEMFTLSHATQPRPPVRQSQTYTPHIAQPQAEMSTLSHATQPPQTFMHSEGPLDLSPHARPTLQPGTTKPVLLHEQWPVQQHAASPQTQVTTIDPALLSKMPPPHQ